MQTTVVGGYPKILDDQLVRKTLWKVDREGESARPELEKALDTVTRSAIRDLEEAGIDVVSDGGIRWQDEVTPAFRGAQGCKITGLIRYFDTNTLYRQPVITGDLKFDETAFSKEYTFATQSAKKPVRAIVTGPYTLAKCSLDEHYNSLEKLTLAIAGELTKQVKALEAAGAKQIHINEPFILQTPQDWELFKKAITQVTSGLKAEVTLYFSFGDFAKIFPKVAELNVARIGFDFTLTPNAKQIIADPAFKGKKLLAGIVDARNTKLETSEEISGWLKAITENFSASDVEIAPSNSLEFLPIDRCQPKVKNLVAVVSRFKEGK